MAAVTSLFKKPGDGGAALAAREAAANQRRALASMSKEQSITDGAAGKSGRKGGRSLLSYLGAEGAGGLAAA